MEPAEVESLLEIEDSSAESWFGVFRRLRENRDKIQTPETVEILCHALLRKVEDIGCKDKYCLFKIFRIIEIWLNGLPFEIGDNFHLRKTLKRCESCVFIALGMKWFRKFEVKAIKMLLNYGYLYPIDFYHGSYNIDSIEAIYWFRRMIAPELDLDEERRRALCYRLQLLDPFLCHNVDECRELRVYQRGHKRILLAALCIRVLNKRNTNNAEQYYLSLRLYFRAVADPFVQADEVGELLRFFFFDVNKDFADHTVDALVQDFKRLYPESQGPYRPRSLKHLCRCAIRQKLNHVSKFEVLPVLLDDLRLPRNLKMYIMGDL